MKKTKQLNSLFEKWESSNKDYTGRFIRDGIIDESIFEAPGNKKLLIIAKEPNYQDDGSWDFRDWWKTKLQFSFSIRLAEWAYGIENNFPIYSKIQDNQDEQLKAIHKMAFMNIKKIGGNGTSDQDKLMDFAIRDHGFIRKQIEIIEPEIIVLCLSWGKLEDSLFPEIKTEWKDCGYDIFVASYKGVKYISFYHPSARNAPAAAYSLLQNVVRSEVFRSL